METERIPIEVKGLTMKYGPLVVMQDLSFQVERGEIFVIMGGSGSVKSWRARSVALLAACLAALAVVGGAVAHGDPSSHYLETDSLYPGFAKRPSQPVELQRRKWPGIAVEIACGVIARIDYYGQRGRL